MKTESRGGLVVAWVVALLVLASCGRPDVEAQTGSAQLQVVLAQELSGADVKRVAVEIRGSGIAPPITSELVQAGSGWQGTVNNIPAGPDRVIDASALDAAGKVLFQGSSAPLAMGAGATVNVLLTLQQVGAPPPYENEAPRITSLAASANTVKPSGSLSLVATAMDPNGDALSYSWKASGGTFSAPTQPSTPWTAPATEGIVQLTLDVTDARGSAASVSFSVSVQKDGSTGSAQVTVGFNTWPEVKAMKAVPSVLQLDKETLLSASVLDADGDTPKYTWSTACTGTFFNASAATPGFTLKALPTAGRCLFQVVVSDGRGGQHQGTLALQAGGGTAINVAPQVDSVWQSLTQAHGGQGVTLGLTAHDPEGKTVSFSWSAASGSIQATRWTSTSGEADWVAPACFDAAVSITASVVDADGGRTQRVFSVSPSESAKCGAQSVSGLSRVHHIQQDGSSVVTPEDLSAQPLGAWVPTADGSGYVFHAGTGQADGTFVIPGVDRTPYLFQQGGSYRWMNSRVLDLSYPSLGRAGRMQEPEGTQLALSLQGLTPWQPYADDIQLQVPGAGIGYQTRGCILDFVEAGEGATFLNATYDYHSYFESCANPASRIEPAKGDLVYAAQSTYRYDTAGAVGLDITEVRRAATLGVSSTPGSVSLAGTLTPLSLVSRTLDFRASQFSAQALASHPQAKLTAESAVLTSLTRSLDLGLFAGSLDLATATNYAPGQGDFLVNFTYGNPFPADWSRLLMIGASATAPFSVPLPEGGFSKTARYTSGAYSQRLLDPTGTQVLESRVGVPGNPRINGLAATTGHLTGVGTTPVLSWTAPAQGTSMSYLVRLYEISGTSSGTYRSLLASLHTSGTQLRLPPGLLVSGKSYFALVRAYFIPGYVESRPYFTGPDYDYAGVFSSTFTP